MGLDSATSTQRRITRTIKRDLPLHECSGDKDKCVRRTWAVVGSVGRGPVDRGMDQLRCRTSSGSRPLRCHGGVVLVPSASHLQRSSTRTRGRLPQQRIGPAPRLPHQATPMGEIEDASPSPPSSGFLHRAVLGWQSDRRHAGWRRKLPLRPRRSYPRRRPLIAAVLSSTNAGGGTGLGATYSTPGGGGGPLAASHSNRDIRCVPYPQPQRTRRVALHDEI